VRPRAAASWVALTLVWVGCGGAPAGSDDLDADALAADGADGVADAAEPPLSVVAVSFNTGTSGEVVPDDVPEGGFGARESEITDAWYGNGLNWPPLVEDTAALLAAVAPDVVAFQEIFWTGECSDIPDDNRTGFVCEGWAPGDPTVAQLLLGAGFQIACHVGKPDKCVAVRRGFGTIRGCVGDLCLDGAFGATVEGCGRGARIGRVVVDLVAGGELTVVNVHGSSGFSADDQACRVRQVEQVFVDLGDGAPAASGERNLVLGDLNTDPGRAAEFDPSAARWLDFVGDGRPFHWLSAVGTDVAPTYAGLVNIDHAASDALVGSCWSPTVTPGHGAFTDVAFFDHLPLVCMLTEE